MLTDSEERELLALLEAEDRAASVGLTFREFAESPAFCALSLSPLTAAIADASEGIRPTTIDDAECELHFGCKLDELPREPRRTVGVRAGGRGGKTSRLLAPKAVHAAWTVPVPLLGKGEEAYSIIVAPSLKLARQALSFCKGYVDASPELSRAVTSESTDHIALTRPDGTRVRIEVFAASRGGASLRGKTLIFAGFDEACFFLDESTGVVNDAELYRAVIQRVVPGGQVWIVSTPWLAGVGLLEEQISKNFGSHELTLCVVAPTRALNPSWDPTGEIERDMRESDPDNADREIGAVPLTAGSLHFFSHEALEAAVNKVRPLQLPKTAGRLYGAGGDCGFKRNSSALVIVERDGDKFRVAVVEERKPLPGLPLKPAAVVGEFATIMLGYDTRELVVDSHERDAVAEELMARRMSAVPAPDKLDSHMLARKIVHEGRCELPHHPRFLRQLKDIMSKPMPGGGHQITSPKKADGSHGDLASAFVNALWRAANHSAPGRVTVVGTARTAGW